MQKTSFLSQEEIGELSFAKVGENVKISRKASFYGSEITIGDNVRIDDFCILSGRISIGSHVHISAFTALYGSMGIEIEDYAGLSPRCTVFSATDDFSGDYLIGPMVDDTLTNITGGLVRIGMYSQIGAGCIILPNITISEGVAVGAMSLVKKSIDPWKIAYGIPAKVINERSKGMLNLIKQVRK